MANTALDSRLAAVRTQGRLEPGVVDRFAAFLADAPEEALFRMSPLRWAAANGLSERVGIDLFLHAAHAGILEITWGVVCPACAGFLTTSGGLRALAESKRCDMCEIDVASALDESVEVAFTVSPSTRHIRFHTPENTDLVRDGAAIYFSSSLDMEGTKRRTMAEVLVAAARVPGGETHTIEATVPAGRYVIVAPASHTVARLHTAPGGPRELDFDLLDGQFIPSHSAIAEGPVALRIRNRTNRTAALAFIQDPKPPPELLADYAGKAPRLLPYLDGKRLITSQVFRELFRAESIPSEGGLSLKNLTVLFTDLKGSTEMYERIGDLRAYDLVRRHFRVLRDVVSDRGGAVVKTIGDAIMASFAESAPALEAAARMGKELRDLGMEEDLLLKVGLHAGPCIAVELNDRLDYFGQTVNVAARVQGIAEAQEIVVTDAVHRAPGVSEIIRRAELRERPQQVALKGVGGATSVVRLS